ncbi:MAG: hypothetical protein R2713_21835 [Ilumatobacteraceae bacterium]
MPIGCTITRGFPDAGSVRPCIVAACPAEGSRRSTADLVAFRAEGTGYYLVPLQVLAPFAVVGAPRRPTSSSPTSPPRR